MDILSALHPYFSINFQFVSMLQKWNVIHMEICQVLFRIKQKKKLFLHEWKFSTQRVYSLQNILNKESQRRNKKANLVAMDVQK